MATSPDGVEKRAAEPSAQRPASVAELASLRDSVHMFRLRFAGMLLRALDAELGIGNTTPPIRAQRARLATRYDEWIAEAAAAGSAEPIPIRSLVANQYAAMVATAHHLARRRAGEGAA
jgi:hypothetical protein